MPHVFSVIRTLPLALAALLLTTACESEATNSEVADGADAATPMEVAEAPSSNDTPPAGASGTYGDIVYGDPDAPVTVIEYASYTCGACGRWAAVVLPQLDEKYIKTGQAKFIFRNFIRDRVDLAAAMTVRCKTPDVAKVLNKNFFQRQGEWLQTPDVVNALASMARRAGISRVDFDRCLADTDMRDHVVKMTQDGGKEFEIRGTPTVIVNGETVGLDWASLDEAIADRL